MNEYKLCQSQRRLKFGLQTEKEIFAFAEYNQQDATFHNLIYFCKTFYVFQAGFPSITRSSKLHIQPQVFVRQILLPAARRKNRIKHAQFLTEINKL